MKENHQTDKTSEAYKRLKEILGEEPSEDYAKARIKLKNLTIDDFSVIFPLIRNIRTLDLSDSTISNFSELLKLDDCNYFYLDNVSFINNDSNIIKDFPYEIHFSNMNFDAECLNGLRASRPKKGYKYFKIQNCHIDNIQELGNIAGLSKLVLDEITFTHHPKKIKEKSIRRIDISDSQFDNISFIPFKKSVRNIDFTNCRIGSFEGISEFKKLEVIGFDNHSTVEDTRELENPFNKKITCDFYFFKKCKKPLDLKNLLVLKNYIYQLNFSNFKGKAIDNLEKFERLHHLTFDKSKFYVDAFLSIAKQIQSVEVRDSAIKKHSYFKHFPNLTTFKLNCVEEESIYIRNFSKLLPLKKQLKELDFYESHDKPASYPIEKFTALESLTLGCNISVKTAQSILNLKKIRKLEIRIEKSKKVIDIGNLKKLEFLNINSESNLRCMGFEYLKRLKSLKISSYGIINTLPRMESLKRLSFSAYGCKIKGLSRFPNLEFLSLQGVKKLQLKNLKKLKVLDLDSSRIKNFSSFKTLPSLEKLDLSCVRGDINLKEISKFPNLKWLTFLESFGMKDISALEPLKKLERLDLYQTEITDVRVLNTLPNLKEVNLAVWNYKKANLAAQLDRPEIAIYCGLPTINLWIWEKDEFGI